MDYTVLHLHTEYSLLDGFNQIEKLAKHLNDIGVKACSITDHGNMFGAIEFYKTMKKYGIKPIIGLEAYIHNNDDISFKMYPPRPGEKIGRKDPIYHLCLYAKDEIGYKNLMYLTSMSYIKGYYYKPRINKKILREHAQGLICSSACLAGEIARNVNFNQQYLHKNNPQGYEHSKKVIMEFKEMFGDDFYLEIMRHGLYDELNIDDDLIRLAKETNTKLIATNDAHYTYKEQALLQKISFTINTQSVKSKSSDDDFDTDDKALAHLPADDRLKRTLLSEFYVKSADEMLEIFADIPEAVANTNEIANKCNLQIKLGNATPPNFKFTREYAAKLNLSLPEPNNEYSLANDSALFEYQCHKGLQDRLRFIDTSRHGVYKARLEQEIQIINNMKFPGYMLIVADFIGYAKSQGIPVGPGRGSAAGSLVAYALKITDIDPIPYNLLFERFLNPERISMPDIDVDFCQDRRGEVIDYVIEKYGEYNVAQVVTFGKMLAKGAVRDVARVMEVPYDDADKFAKLIPDEPGITLTKRKNKIGEYEDGAYEKEPKIAEQMAKDVLLERTWEYACGLEGYVRNTGMHAAGIVISNEPLWNKTPLWHPTTNRANQHVTQYYKDYLEDVDLIKFDFLGLKTLTVIENAKKLIKARFNKEIIWEQIDFNDPKTYETIQSGDTLGIFQIESSGMQDLAAKLKPDCFEDIIAMIALYRPGPLESGMVDDFIAIKHGLKKAEYAFSSLEPILSPTYGVIVYQEQVMQVVQEIGGFSLGGADLVRRAMSKKKEDEMIKIRAQYLEGARNKGYDENKASDLFELIMKFAAYGFNKSHSAAYGMVCFQTAYLKTYYPAEFMAALLTSEGGNVDKISKYKDEINRLGYAMLPPNVNESMREFSVTSKDGKDAIIYGLDSIKMLGTPVVDAIIKERGDKPFANLGDFLGRVSSYSIFNKKGYEALIKAGAVDIFGINRRTFMENIEQILEQAKAARTAKEELAGSLFADDESMQSTSFDLSFIREFSEYSKKDMLAYEKEVLGFYASGHPLDEYKEQIESVPHTNSSQLENAEDASEVMLIGTIEKYDSKIFDSGTKMHILTVMDMDGNTEIVAYDAYNKIENKGNGPFGFKVKVNKNGERMRLALVEAYELSEAKNVKLKAGRISDDEIKANAELFASPHAKISELSSIKAQSILIAKISSYEQKTSKAGNIYARIDLIDESGAVQLTGFSDCLQMLQDSNPKALYGVIINPSKDNSNKPTIASIVQKEQICEFVPYKERKRSFKDRVNNSDSYGAYNGFNDAAQSLDSIKKAACNEPIEITGELAVEIDLRELSHKAITAIHALASRENGSLRLILHVKSPSSQTYLYRTSFGVSEGFDSKIKRALSA